MSSQSLLTAPNETVLVKTYDPASDRKLTHTGLSKTHKQINKEHWKSQKLILAFIKFTEFLNQFMIQELAGRSSTYDPGTQIMLLFTPQQRSLLNGLHSWSKIWWLLATPGSHTPKFKFSRKEPPGVPIKVIGFDCIICLPPNQWLDRGHRRSCYPGLRPTSTSEAKSGSSTQNVWTMNGGGMVPQKEVWRPLPQGVGMEHQVSHIHLLLF